MPIHQFTGGNSTAATVSRRGSRCRKSQTKMAKLTAAAKRLGSRITEKRQMELVEEEEVSQVTDRQVERGRIGDEGLCEQVRNRIDPPPDGHLKDDRGQHEDGQIQR